MLFAFASMADLDEIILIEKQRNLSNFGYDNYLRFLSDSDHQILVSRSSEAVLGFLALRLIMVTKEAEILNIGVKSDSEGKGIGTGLLDFAIINLLSWQIREIWLEVRESNIRAKDLYLRNGFVIMGKRKDYYDAPKEDALLMKMTLPSRRS